MSAEAPRILFVSPMLPGGGHGGGNIATANFTSAMREAGAQVAILGFSTRDGPPEAGEISVGRLTPETTRSPVRALAWGARSLLTHRAYTIQKWMSEAYRALLRRTLTSQAWDLIVVEHAQMAWVLPHLDGRPFVFLAHNAESQVYAELAAISSGMTARIYAREDTLMRSAELRLARQARQVWTLSESDADYFASLGAGVVECFPVSSLAVNLRPPPALRPGAALLGTWTWRPNRVGLDWYLDEVHPLLSADIAVQIGGRGIPEHKCQALNLECLGYVDDAAAFLAASMCILVPSTRGGGIQIKTLDAIATGRPVVATPFAVRDLKALPSSVHVAETPRDFARATAALVRRNAGFDPSGPKWLMARRKRMERQVAAAMARLLVSPSRRDRVGGAVLADQGLSQP